MDVGTLFNPQAERCKMNDEPPFYIKSALPRVPVLRVAALDSHFFLDQAHPAALGFQRGIPLLSAAVTAARICGENGGPLLSVQLDHGTEEDHVMAALEAGVDSVMWVSPRYVSWMYNELAAGERHSATDNTYHNMPFRIFASTKLTKMRQESTGTRGCS